jgi:hypothetical protein
MFSKQPVSRINSTLGIDYDNDDDNENDRRRKWKIRSGKEMLARIVSMLTRLIERFDAGV